MKSRIEVVSGILFLRLGHGYLGGHCIVVLFFMPCRYFRNILFVPSILDKTINKTQRSKGLQGHCLHLTVLY